MRLILRLPLILALSSLATPCLANADEQEAIDGALSPWSETKGLDTIRHLASCTVDRFPNSAQLFVRDVGDDAYLIKNSETLFAEKCIKKYFFKTSTTSISADIYLPVLAEILLVQDYEISDIPDSGRVSALDHPNLPSVDIESVHPRYREMFVIDKINYNLERTAECVARAYSQGVFRLAQSAPASADERAQLDAMQETIANCGGAKITVTFPSFVWRGALVKNLYRLVDAARPVTHSQGAPDA